MAQIRGDVAHGQAGKLPGKFGGSGVSLNAVAAENENACALALKHLSNSASNTEGAAANQCHSSGQPI